MMNKKIAVVCDDYAQYRAWLDKNGYDAKNFKMLKVQLGF